MAERLGASLWLELARSNLAAFGAVPHGNTFRRDGDVWFIAYGGATVHLPDSKGLHDLAILLRQPGQQIAAVQLLTPDGVLLSGDPILDERAKASYKQRMAELDGEIAAAEADNDPYRADRARAEREALIRELSAAAGLGGRSRRLGDQRERGRKAVTARVRDASERIDRFLPTLGAHLRASVRTGAWCSYSPDEPNEWET